MPAKWVDKCSLIVNFVVRGQALPKVYQNFHNIIDFSGYYTNVLLL
jgi:hypothetical protein